MLCHSTAFAQAVDSGALQRQQRALDRPVIPPTPPPDTSTLRVEEPRPQNNVAPSGGKLFVSRFKLLTPSPLLSDAELNALLVSYVGRENTVAELQSATERVSAEIRARGYIFSRVLVPQQEVMDGVIALELIPGKLSTQADGQRGINITPKGAMRLDEQRARNVVASAVNDPQGLNVRELERGMLLLNDLPGVRGTGLIVPGREPGTLDLALDIGEERMFGGWFGVDNFGSRATGEARAVADMHLFNPSGRGDAAELYLSRSEDTWSATASYSLPLGLSGLRGRVAASYMDYALQETFADVDADGDSSWYSAGLSYPLRRGRYSSLFLTGTIDAKRLRDRTIDINTSSRDSESASVGVQGTHVLANNMRLLDYSVTLTGGSLDRSGNADDLFVDQVTRQTDGDYGIARITGNWLEQLAPRFSLSAALEMQFADSNLDTSEKMYLGGPRGIRAYPLEEAGSDEAQSLSIEARWLAAQLPQWRGQEWTLFGLFDVGRAVRNHNLWTGWNTGMPQLRNDYVLKGYGVGIRGQIARVLQVEVVGAHTLGDNPGASVTGLNADGRSDDSRFWAVASISF